MRSLSLPIVSQPDAIRPRETTTAPPKSRPSSAGGHLRIGAGRRDQPPSADQPRSPTLRQSGPAPRDGAEPRPQGVHRYPQRRPGRHRRRVAAAAWRPVGHAAGDVANAARLRPGYREESGRGPADYAEARLWAEQPAEDQAVDPRPDDLSRPCGHYARPAEAGVY